MTSWLLFTSLLFNSHALTNGYIIAEVIDYIVDDFLTESCDLNHKDIILYSGIPEEEIKEVLQQVRDLLPHLDISYQILDSENKQCAVKKGDVGIRMSDKLWRADDGTFKCGFQSNLENIFGTLEFTITTKDGVPSIGVPQLIGTVIDYPMPK